MDRPDLIKITAFTFPDVYRSVSRPNTAFQYERVAALWEDDGRFGRHVGERDTSNLRSRELTMAAEVGSRILVSFQRICDGEAVNCARFGRDVLGMPSTLDEPTTNLEGMPLVNELSEGTVGLVGVKGFGVAHVVGYGLGTEGLQVMSSRGEFGFANNTDVLSFYGELYPGCETSLHQMPNLSA